MCFALGFFFLCVWTLFLLLQASAFFLIDTLLNNTFLISTVPLFQTEDTSNADEHLNLGWGKVKTREESPVCTRGSLNPLLGSLCASLYVT